MTIHFDEAIPRVRDRWHANDDAIMNMVGQSALRAQEVAGGLFERVQDAVGDAAPIVASTLQEQLIRAQARAEHELEDQESLARDKAAVVVVIMVVAAVAIGVLALVAKRRRSARSTRKRDRRSKRAKSQTGGGRAN